MTYPTRDPDFAALRLQMARVRNERGWTFDKLEAESGVHRRTLIAMEHGTTNGRLDSWFRVAESFGIPAGEFFSVL